MPTLARFYIGVVISGGIALAAYCAASPWHGETRRLVAYVAITMLASVLKIRLPRMEGTVSAGFVIFLVAVAQFTIAESVIIAGVSALVQCYWKSARRPKFVQVLFNVSALGLSVAASFWLAPVLVSRTLTPAFSVVAGTVYFLCNTLMVSTVIGLVTRTSVRDIWYNCHVSVFPYYMIGAAISSIMAITGSLAGWVPELFVFPFMVLVYAWYRAFLAASEQKRFAAEEQMQTAA